ncbi:hypothetical protein MTO96_050676, partial [Rhipicephalus appendiculatus]
TEKLYTKAVQTVADRYGKQYTWELKQRVMGIPGKDAARLVIDGLGLPLGTEEYLKEMDRLYAEMFPSAELMPGVERLVRHLKKHNVPMAIATSSKPSSFELKMTKHRDLVALFHHVVMSGGNPEVKHGKPHPDVFLVLVFEDAPKGVTAALAAGMQVIIIPDPRMDEENRRRATLCIASLLDFKPEQFGLPPFEDGPEDGPKDVLEDGLKPEME